MVTAAPLHSVGGVACCPGRGGKVCVCQGYWSCSCHKCGLREARGQQWQGLGRSVAAWSRTAVCFAMRILVTFQCCLLVSASDCIDVCNFLVLLMLTRYQRIRRPFIITLYYKNNRVRKKIDLKLPTLILSSLVGSQPLDLGNFYTGVAKTLNDYARIRLETLRRAIATYRRLVCKGRSSFEMFIMKHLRECYLHCKGFVL